MAITVDELSVIIKANNEQFVRTLNETNQKLYELKNATGQASGSQGIGGMATAFAIGNIASNIATQSISRLFSVVSDLTGAVIANGSHFSRMGVVTNVVARNTGITTEKLKEMRDALIDANVYGVQGENVIRALAYSGIVPFADSLSRLDERTGATKTGITAMVLAFKDLSAAAGIESVEGIQQLTDFINGQLASTNASGIIQVGSLATEYRAYADKIGKARQELNTQEEAQARFNIVMRESQKALGAYAASLLSSEKAMQSAGMAWVSVTEILGSYLEPIFATFANGLFQLVSAIRDAIIGTEAPIRNWAEQVAAYIVVAFRLLGMFLKQLTGNVAFDKLANFKLGSLTPATKNVNDLSKGMGGLSKSTSDAADSADKLKKELAGLAPFDEMNVLKQGKEVGSTGGGLVNPLANLTKGGGDLGIDFNPDKINADAQTIIDSMGGLESSLEQVTNVAKIAGIILIGLGLIFLGLTNPIGLLIGVVGALGLVIGVNLGQAIADVFSPAGNKSMVTQIEEASNTSVAQMVAMTEGIEQSLVDLQINGKSISQQMAKDMIGNVNKIKEESIKKNSESVAKQIADLNKLKASSTDITDKQYQEMLQKIISGGKKKEEQITKNGNEVNRLIQEAADKGIVIDEKMREEIVKNLEGLRDDSVSVMTDNKDQQIKVMELLKETSGKISADTASHLIQNAEKARLGEVKSAEDKFNKTKQILEDLRFKSGAITDEQYKELLKKAETDKNNSIDMAQKKKDGVVKKVSELAGENIKQVDTNNGQMKSKFQIFIDGIGAGITKAWEDLKKGVKGITDGISGEWNKFWGTTLPQGVKKLNEAIGTAVASVWESIKKAIKDGINTVINTINGWINGVNNFIHMVGSWGGIFTFLKYITIQPIPKMAQGGVVSSPTLAMLGEAGKEAVVPLENNTGWINNLADMLNKKGAGNMQLIVKIGEDQIYSKFVDYVNEKSMLGNSLLINV